MNEYAKKRLQSYQNQFSYMSYSKRNFSFGIYGAKKVEVVWFIIIKYKYYLIIGAVIIIACAEEQWDFCARN